MCSEGYFFDANGTGLCRPECGQLQLAEIGLVIIVQVCGGIGLVTFVLMIVLAVTIQRKTL